MNLVKISETEFINFDHVQRVSMSTTESGFHVRVDFEDSDTSRQYGGDEARRIAEYCDANLSYDCTLPNEAEPSMAELIARDARENELEMWRGKRPGG